TVEIAKNGEHRAHPVEGARDRVSTALDALVQPLGLPLKPGVALGPARVVLTVLAAVARVRAQGFAQPGDLAVIGGRRPFAARPLRLLALTQTGLAAQGRGQVAAGRRRLVIERLR